MKINIIGDIAGRYRELMALLKSMPEADLILSVGDMMDRGSDSNKVIEWFMQAQTVGRAEALYGNHEDLMIQGTIHDDNWNWIRNGGAATIRSYADKSDQDLSSIIIDPVHTEWLQKRPMYFQLDDLFVSHAPVTSLKYIPKDPYGRDEYFIWNRYEPKKAMNKFVINGHNGLLKEYKSGDGTVFGMCIDDSHNEKLTGLHWPSKQLFQVDYFK